MSANAIPSRLGRPAAIRRAAITSRLVMRELLDAQSASLRRLLDGLSGRLRWVIERHLGIDGRVGLGSLAAVRAQSATIAGDHAVRLQSLIDSALLASAQAGAAVIGGYSVAAELRAVGRALAFLREFRAADGLQLSDRIWRVNQRTLNLIGETLEQAIASGASAIETAQALIAGGLAIPGDIRQRIDGTLGTALGRAVDGALLKGPDNALFNANRLLLTEMNRAYSEAFVAGIAEHPDIAGVRFLLSPNHPRVDICDMHAAVNMHGLGDGVYPVHRHPFPAHPMTLSYLEPVFVDEITDADRAGRQTRAEWLRGQSHDVQNAILGLAKARAFRAGRLPEHAFRTPWRVVRQRLEGQGFDTEPLARQSRQPAAAVPEDSNRTDIPVSKALDVLVHKTVAERALAALDKVHTDGVLPRIPLRNITGSSLGQYVRTIDGKAVEIGLKRGDMMESVLLHEIGHFLDHQGMGTRGVFVSEVRTELSAAWLDAVASSSYIKKLKGLFERATEAEDRYRLEFLEYLLRPREVFARSYAQWIALRSGDKAIISQIDQEIGTMQWHWDDFAPVATALDNLFKSLGWLR